MYEFSLHEPLVNKSKHNHEDHSHEYHHTNARSVDKKILKISLLMTFSMMLVQFTYSLLSNSLVLLSDTLHTFPDVFALTLNFLTIVAIEKWQDHQKTSGYFRLEILVVFINALTIILPMIFITYEAIGKLINPSSIDIKTMIIIAVLGFLVNAINAFMIFRGANLEDVDMKSAPLHMMSDLLGSLVVIIGGIAVYFSGIVYTGTILAIILSLLLLRWAITLLKQGVNILLETSPMDIEEVKQASLLNSKVKEVIDLHITQITNEMLVASMHLRVSIDDLKELEQLSYNLSHDLLHRFEIGHVTIQPLRSKNEV